MNVIDRKPQPESWDEATDIRRFWWLIFPAGIAVWAAGLLIFVDGGSSAFGFLREPLRRTDRFEQTMPAAPGQEIRLENIRGRVIIRTGEPGEVRVLVERTAEARNEAQVRRSLDAIKTNIQHNEEFIRIFMAGVSGEPRSAVTTVTLMVPPGARIDAQTLAGDITIEVESAVEIAAGTANGNIDVRIAEGTTLNTWVQAKELRAQFEMERSSEPGGRVLFQSRERGGYLVELDLLAPDGRVTLRLR